MMRARPLVKRQWLVRSASTRFVFVQPVPDVHGLVPTDPSCLTQGEDSRQCGHVLASRRTAGFPYSWMLSSLWRVSVGSPMAGPTDGAARRQEQP